MDAGNHSINMTNHRRATTTPVSLRQWLALAAMAVLAGSALGWSLRQIRAEREMHEAPRVQLREFPSPNPLPIRETERGISFIF